MHRGAQILLVVLLALPLLVIYAVRGDIPGDIPCLNLNAGGTQPHEAHRPPVEPSSDLVVAVLPLDDYDEFAYLPLVLNDYPPVVLVPEGHFQMGCDDDNPSESCEKDERPLHTVYLDPYVIDRYEVTNAQYAEFLNAVGNQTEAGETWFNADDSGARIHSADIWRVESGYEDHPVVLMTWYGARAYCRWRGKRLPTEAEWEKAARGDSDTLMYPWGNGEPDCSRANYDNCEGSPTTPIGSYPSGASPYGVLDMAGNVWEWTNDWYASDYYEMSPDTNPVGPDHGDYKVIRGGGWYGNWTSIRVADRIGDMRPVRSWFSIGFRCARSVSKR